MSLVTRWLGLVITEEGVGSTTAMRLSDAAPVTGGSQIRRVRRGPPEVRFLEPPSRLPPCLPRMLRPFG